jgi:hypothetical protein
VRARRWQRHFSWSVFEKGRSGHGHLLMSVAVAAIQHEAETGIHSFDDWFDPIEAGPRDRVRDFIETMIGAAGPGR